MSLAPRRILEIRGVCRQVYLMLNDGVQPRTFKFDS